MAPPLLILQDIHLSFGGAGLLEAAELVVSPGDRLCLVGRNGSGKSTLLKIAAGSQQPDRGSRFIQPGVALRYLPQAPDLTGHGTVQDFVASGLGDGDDPHLARAMLGRLGLSGHEDPDSLSGGEAQRAALARVLAPKPDILLLDEPTNHLDLPAIEWLERELKGSRTALVLISHDRRFLENLARATIWLDRGAIRRLDRGFAHFEAWRDAILETEAMDRHKLKRKIARENDWLRYGVTARRKRNQGRLRALHALRQKKRDQRPASGAVKLIQSAAAVSGKLISEAEGIGKSFGDLTVVKDFSLRIKRGSRIGLIGPNGAGKTTLMRMLTGVLPPDTGVVTLGAKIEMITLDQRRESLDPHQTLTEALTGGVSGSGGDTVFIEGRPRHVIGYMKDFLFTANQARTPIGALSGGERGRLMLARALARPSNLMVLDEPTNDLDLETLDLLQELLADYSGTLILISHDRDFLDRVATSVIAAEGDGRWVEYAGGYSDMIDQRGAGPAAPVKAATVKSRAAKPRAGRKFSFKDKHALDAVGLRMAALQDDIAGLRKDLDDPAFYGRDRASFTAKSKALDTAMGDLAAVEEQWLALEMRREEAEKDSIPLKNY